jgi:hypothetical protein
MTKKLLYKVKDINRKIEMFDGRPDRNTVIDQEDIINLKIALENKAPKGHDQLFWFLLHT